jgi:hypothetical protein
MDERCVTNRDGARDGLVSDHSGLAQVADIYELAVGSPLSLLTFFAAAKKVSAAPHRGEANRPIRNQGEVNAVGKQPKANLARPITKQGEANALRRQPKATPNRPPRNQAKANAVGKQPKAVSQTNKKPTLKLPAQQAAAST